MKKKIKLSKIKNSIIIFDIKIKQYILKISIFFSNTNRVKLKFDNCIYNNINLFENKRS